MQEKFEKAQYLLIFLTILFLPFGAIPKGIQIQAFGAIFSRYTLYIGLLLFVLEILFFHTYRNRKYFIFFFLLIAVAMSSLIVGVYHYPYEQLSNYPVTKLIKFLSIMNRFSFDINYNDALPWWLFIREVKNMALDLAIYFLFPYQIFCLFKNSKGYGFQFIKKAFIFLAVFMGLYSLIEIPYLSFESEWAKHLLAITTPWFTDVSGGYNWWPPLIWKGQLRSLCPEPPHFGIISAICEVFFAYEFIVNKECDHRGALGIFIFYFTIMVFLSKARTALGLFLGEQCLIFIYLLCLKYRKLYIKSFIKLISIFTMSFVFSILPSYISGEKGDLVGEYVTNNITSVKEDNVRSNRTRFVMAKACWKVGLDHPLLGVGKDLKDPYLYPYVRSYGEDDPEIKLWLNDYDLHGPLKSPFPTTNQLLLVFAEYGLLGVLLFLSPLGIIVVKIWNNKAKLLNLKTGFTLIILSGQIVAMFSAVGWITYPLFVGLLFSELEKC